MSWIGAWGTEEFFLPIYTPYCKALFTPGPFPPRPKRGPPGPHLGTLGDFILYIKNTKGSLLMLMALENSWRTMGALDVRAGLP